MALYNVAMLFTILKMLLHVFVISIDDWMYFLHVLVLDTNFKGNF